MISLNLNVLTQLMEIKNNNIYIHGIQNTYTHIDILCTIPFIYIYLIIKCRLPKKYILFPEKQS